MRTSRRFGIGDEALELVFLLTPTLSLSPLSYESINTPGFNIP